MLRQLADKASGIWPILLRRNHHQRLVQIGPARQILFRTILVFAAVLLTVRPPFLGMLEISPLLGDFQRSLLWCHPDVVVRIWTRREEPIRIVAARGSKVRRAPGSSEAQEVTEFHKHLPVGCSPGKPRLEIGVLRIRVIGNILKCVCVAKIERGPRMGHIGE